MRLCYVICKRERGGGRERKLSFSVGVGIFDFDFGWWSEDNSLSDSDEMRYLC